MLRRPLLVLLGAVARAFAPCRGAYNILSLRWDPPFLRLFFSLQKQNSRVTLSLPLPAQTATWHFPIGFSNEASLPLLGLMTWSASLLINGGWPFLCPLVFCSPYSVEGWEFRFPISSSRLPHVFSHLFHRRKGNFSLPAFFLSGSPNFLHLGKPPPSPMIVIFPLPSLLSVIGGPSFLHPVPIIIIN